MFTEHDDMSLAARDKARRDLLALQKRIAAMHELRNEMNRALARVHADNLDLALTQKKNLRRLSSEYDKLSRDVRCLPPMDATAVLEDEYNYILTIGNIIETTRELKKGTKIEATARQGILDGLIQFYDGLRDELARQDAAAR
ncbi:sporulation-specific protein 15 [Mitsuokella sp.]|uniref:sporulation-specific protein 15 n=1 Tax=Mitsuokella TaxID=52225 RepID=UPI0029E496A5|nr:sporulation-specific protein 15 [Mitsuokella sp.]MDD6382523.1 sporulation-specific protein 15 [Selenomonadaceae bacterium]MDY4474525.1 sporulation-specific protein 15 [Mitsuokella sp.]